MVANSTAEVNSKAMVHMACNSVKLLFQLIFNNESEHEEKKKKKARSTTEADFRAVTYQMFKLPVQEIISLK